MTTPILEAAGFAVAVIDALASHICVTDQDGIIVTVNRAWRNFGLENPPVSSHSGVGTHYLDVCRSASGPGSDEAGEFALGIQAVLEGRTELFQMEYPCHSATQDRWFLGRVTPLRVSQGGAVISHQTITDRKLLELELIRLAATDPLTGAPNRRYFFEAGNREVERVRRFGVPASLLMIDLDHFKAVNDRHGHAAGDEALRSMTRTCKRFLRQIDVLARFGGEEFVVMLPGTDETEAAGVAEKLRRIVAEAPVEHDKIQFNLTASFGVAEVLPGDQSIDECLARADSALYAAKRSGRNRVMRSANPQES